jgi:hypothetical protein
MCIWSHWLQLREVILQIKTDFARHSFSDGGLLKQKTLAVCGMFMFLNAQMVTSILAAPPTLTIVSNAIKVDMFQQQNIVSR